MTLSEVMLAVGIIITLENNSYDDHSIQAHLHTLYSKWSIKYGSLKSTPSRVFYNTYSEI